MNAWQQFISKFKFANYIGNIDRKTRAYENSVDKQRFKRRTYRRIRLILYNLYIIRNYTTLDGHTVRRVWESKRRGRRHKRHSYETQIRSVGHRHRSHSTSHKKDNSYRIKKERQQSREEKCRARWNIFLYNIFLHDSYTSADGEKKQRIYSSLHKYNSYIVNSTAMYVFTNILIYFIHQYSIVLASTTEHIPIKLYYFRTLFLLSDSSSLWTKQSILSIVTVGPLICFVVGVISLVVFRLIENRYGKLFLFWLSLNGISILLGGLFAGYLTREELGYFYDWTSMRDSWQVAISIISIFSIMVIGFWLTRQFLLTANSFRRITVGQKPIFLLAQGIIPCVLGNIFIMLIQFPNSAALFDGKYWNNMIIVWTVLLFILPMFFRNNFDLEGSDFTKSRKYRTLKWFVTITIVLVLTYRILFNHGIEYGV